MKEFFSQLFEFLRRPSTLVAVMVLTGMLLFFPDAWLTGLHVDTLMVSYGWCVGGAFLVSSVLLLVNVGGHVIERVKQNRLLAQRHLKMKETIKTLDATELAVVREFFIQKRHTIQSPVDDAAVAGLLRKGVIERVASIGVQTLAGILVPVTLSRIAAELILIETTFSAHATPEECRKIARDRPRWVRCLEEEECLEQDFLF